MGPQRPRPGGMNRRFGVVAIVLWLAGCSEPEGTLSPEPVATPTVVEDAMPADKVVERLVGVPMAELRRRVDVARVRVATECVQARGYTLDERQKQSLEDIPSAPPVFSEGMSPPW